MGWKRRSLAALLLFLFCGGCGKGIYPGLPEDPVAFQMGEYVDP